MLQVKSFRECQIFNENSVNVETVWSHSSKIFNKMAQLWLDCYLCMSRDVFSASSLDAAQPLQPNEALRPQTCLTLPSGLAACVWQHSSLLRSRPTECQRGWWWCIFWLPRFFPPVYSTLYFLLVPVSAVHLPAADSNPGTGAVIRLNPVPSESPPSPTPPPQACHHPPPKTVIVWTWEHTNTHICHQTRVR